MQQQSQSIRQIVLSADPPSPPRTTHLLPAPLPLQPALPIKTSSLFQFTEFQLQSEFKLKQKQEQVPLSKVKQRRRDKEALHQIGQSVKQLFHHLIYKRHDRIEMENIGFGQTKISPSQTNIPPSNLPSHSQHLQFSSQFQSGNLALVSANSHNPSHYYLFLSPDINSQSITTQWFYFSVKNGKKTGMYTFHIVNYTKPYSCFKMGMLPCVKCKKKSWRRAGENVQYRRNSLLSQEGKSFYTLSFSYDFTQKDDEVYFSYCYPYTFTRLQSFLSQLCRDHSRIIRRKQIAKSLAGNLIELLSITDPQPRQKRIIYVVARCHPGQTVSSFAVEGLLQFLVSSKAAKIRESFVVKVCPMLNPDGVINGNYRCSLSGDDLNRQWKSPHKANHPQVYALKKLIQECQAKKSLFIDIHGHSKKRASFMYGCMNVKSPYSCKELPYLLHKKSSFFNYFSCNFTMPRSKEGTSRIAVHRSCNIQLSYTFQLSFCGPTKQKRHFTMEDYRRMGRQCMLGCGQYLQNTYNQGAFGQVQQVMKQFYGQQQIMAIGAQQTNGSSSQLQDQVYHQINQIPCKHQLIQKKNSLALKQLLSGYVNDPVARSTLRQVHPPPVVSRQLLPTSPTQLDKQKEYLRHRQSMMATRVNIHQMQIHQEGDINYGFTSERGYRPTVVSFFPGEKNVEKPPLVNSSLGGILLPNVQKSLYKKYERYKPERSPRHHPQRSFSIFLQQQLTRKHIVRTTAVVGSVGNRSLHQISLMERIQSKQKTKI